MSAWAVRLTSGRQRRSTRGSARSFDPRVVGELECAAWSAYYRRDWLTLVVCALRTGRHAFGLSWKATIQCSWLVLRANQLWAPFPRDVRFGLVVANWWGAYGTGSSAFVVSP